MAETDTVAQLAGEVASALAPLAAALESPSSFCAFAAELGWDLTVIPTPVAAIGAAVSALVDLLQAGGIDASTAAAAIDAIRATISAIEAINNQPASAFPPTVDPAEFTAHFAAELVDFLLVEYLLSQRPKWGQVLRTLGVIRLTPVATNGKRPAHLERTVAWSDLARVLSDASAVFRDAWQWGTGTFAQQDFFNAVLDVADSLGLQTLVEPLDPALRNALSGGAPGPNEIHDWVLRVPIIGDQRGGAAAELGAGLFMVPATGATQPGFAVLPYAQGTSATEIDITDTLKFTVDAAFALDGGVALVICPDTAPELLFNLIAAAGQNTAAPTGNGLDIGLTSTASSPRMLLGTSDASHLQVGGVSLQFGARLTAGQKLDVYAEFQLSDGLLVINPASGDTDGFISSLLPNGGITAGFQIGVGLSSSQGIYFAGSSRLELQLPVHVSLGPIDVTAATITVTPGPNSIPIGLGATFDGSLGPLQASVENVGLTATLTFPPNNGNLGPVNLALAFQPPTGVGLSVDAGIVAGGGFLSIDTARGEYSGVLQLVLAGFLEVTALGLIDTKLPDGSGFSLLIIITADFGAGIQLGFGFTLNKVGGLLGLNRGMNMQALMDGVRTDAIESVMFPTDVIANAPKIISDLRTFFPPQSGSFLIGPMAQIGWGEPTLATGSLGVIVEIPPGDIAILGVLKVALPADQLAILMLQVNFAGAIEPDKQRLYFFAQLYDSHVLFIAIGGGMGLLVAWGNNANFVLSVGGFHPQYNPPPLPFPAPQRISVDMLNESFARIHADGYFAVTSNTVQFGAHASMYFGFSACNVQGDSGFDALIQFSPFHFTVEISTSFSVQVFGIGMFGIGIDVSLSGPTPWHAHGTASLSFFFFSIGIGIDVTWGDSRNTTLPPVQVMPILVGELGKQSNWKAVFAAGTDSLVILRQLSPDESEHVLHPAGTLQISQQAVPLNLVLDKFGNQQPSDGNRFTVSVSSPDLTKIADHTDQFALAQFKNLDDATKLSQPGYIPENSGVELAGAGQLYATGTAVCREVRYDETVLDTDRRRVFLKFQRLAGTLFHYGLRGNAAARSPVSAAVYSQTHPFSGAVGVNAETFVVAHSDTNTAYTATTFTSQASATDHLNGVIAADPTLAGALHVLPQFEVVS